MDTQGRSRGPRVGRGAPRDAMLVAVLWGRVIVGLALAGAGGMAFGHAWTNVNTPMWWVGGVTLLVGILLALSAVYARSRPPGVVVQPSPPEEPLSSREPLVPLLGAILVYKYQYITQKQLQQALADQLRTVPRRRLGEVLLLRGMLTAAQLEEVLGFQHATTREAEPA